MLACAIPPPVDALVRQVANAAGIKQEHGRLRGALTGPSPDRTEWAGLYALRPSAIWRCLKRQPPSFWLVCTYLFFEYVRPQQIYEAIQGPPYARAVIILALVSFLMERRTIRFRAPDLLLTIFSVIVVASSITAFQPSTSYRSLSDYFAWVIIYFLIANTVDTEERFLVFMLSFLLYSFKMSQAGTRSWAQDGFVFRDWGATGAPGFFQNSGEFGIQMCIFLPLIVAFILALGRNWSRWLRWVAWAIAGTAVTGIIASSSRGALVGLGAVVLWLLLKSRRRFRALLTSIALVGFVYAITPVQQKMRFQEAGTDNTSISRTTAWKNGLEMMRDYPVLGIGYANWMEYRQLNYGYRLLPHNIFIEAGAELGYTGLVTFLALIASTFVINRRTRKLAGRLGDRGRFIFYMAHGLDGALVGFMASGFFVTVLYYPFFWINFAMTVALYNAVLNTLGGESLPALRLRGEPAPRRMPGAVRGVS
jgi:putative inorganic carbon (HCO3(-)) transporter